VLVVVLDAFSRRIVGWSMATTLHTQIVLDALDMALCQRGQIEKTGPRRNISHPAAERRDPLFGSGPAIYLDRVRSTARFFRLIHINLCGLSLRMINI